MIIDRNVFTSITVKIADDFDFDYIEKVVMTIKNSPRGKVVAAYDFVEAGEHVIEITPEQSVKIVDGAVYDFDIITTDHKRYKLTENKSITVREGVGSSND